MKLFIDIYLNKNWKLESNLQNSWTLTARKNCLPRSSQTIPITIPDGPITFYKRHVIMCTGYHFALKFVGYADVIKFAHINLCVFNIFQINK